MSGPRHRRRMDPDAPVVDLADVMADDELVERLRSAVVPPASVESSALVVTPLTRSVVGRHAAGRHRPRASLDPARRLLSPDDPLLRDEVFALLQEWRQDALVAPLPAVPEAPPALLPARRWRRWSAAATRVTAPRSLRPALAISGALAGLLMGSAVVSAKEATPDQALFALTTVFWPQDAASQYALADVRTALNAASEALAADHPSEAVAAADRALQSLDQVDPDDRPSTLQQTVADVRTQATTRQNSQQVSSTSPGPTTPTTTGSPSGSSTEGDAFPLRASSSPVRSSDARADQATRQSSAAAAPASAVAATAGATGAATADPTAGTTGSAAPDPAVVTSGSSGSSGNGGSGVGSQGGTATAEPATGTSAAGSGSPGSTTAGSSSTSGGGQSSDTGSTGSGTGSSSSGSATGATGSSDDGATAASGASAGSGGTPAQSPADGSGGSSADVQIGTAASASIPGVSDQIPAAAGLTATGPAPQPTSEAPPAPQPTPPAPSADPSPPVAGPTTAVAGSPSSGAGSGRG